MDLSHLDTNKPDPRMEPGIVRLPLPDFVELVDAAQFVLNNVVTKTVDGRLRRAKLSGLVQRCHEAIAAAGNSPSQAKPPEISPN